MFINYTEWENFEYTLSSLQLDVNNPRINYDGKKLNQTQIIEYLIKHEKVYELAKKISEEGYFVGEEPIICLENNKKIVLEGNRRTAALKIINDPKKYLSTARANVLNKNVVENNFPVERKVKCFISPNRLLANPIIYSRHKGDALKRWETGNQYAFVAKMYHQEGLSIEDICDILNETSSKVKDCLKAYNLFHEAQIYHQTENGEFIDTSSFDITNLERFYQYEPAKKFLGIDFNPADAGLQILIERDEFNKRLNYMFKELLNSKGFSREFNNDEDKQTYLKRLEKEPSFNFNIKKNDEIIEATTTVERKNLEDAKNKTTQRRKAHGPLQINNVIIPRDYYMSFDSGKLDLLFEELKLLPIERHYSFAILIRTYLEQALYFYLDKRELNERLNAKTNKKRQEDGMAKVKALIKYIKGTNSADIDIDTDNCMRILKFNGDKDYTSASLKIMLDYH